MSLLRGVTGEEVNVVAVELLAAARGTVERWRMDRELPGFGRSVVVKRRDPDSELAAFARVNLETERVALDLLDRCGAGVAPRCIAGGADAGVLVLTDVGEKTVESALFGDNEAEARAALVAVGEAAARLHSVPVDHGHFEGLDTWTIASREPGWATVRAAVGALELPVPSSDVEEEVAELMASLRRPGDAGAMVHGDLVPNNVVLDGEGRARLIDFEGAGFQHIGLDLAMLRFPFVWYGRWAEMPADARDAMEDAYRANASLSAADLRDAVAVGCMAMCILRLERLPRVADVSQTPGAARRRRSQMVWTIEATIEVTSPHPRFAALTNWLSDLRVGMREAWIDTIGSIRYPAFRQ